ncbi:MAG TPA: fumarylacetoacetate hydrolase family protein [Polyangiaceae bacterium]|nr:fumarylacetoacetate hydrolase family protein [Polyangiaceae bacterium]
MRLATLRDGSRDGALVVVAKTGDRCARAVAVAPTLQRALDTWERSLGGLEALAEQLETDAAFGEPLPVAELLAPLPRAYEWVDGSAYPNHVRLVRRARGAEPPADWRTNPLVYQGGSSALLGATAPLRLPDPAWGMDFEAEIAVILADVAEGTRAADAERCVRLVTIANDVTYRGLVAAELAKGFGFFQSKPATAFAPFAVTPDELGAAWRDARVFMRLRSTLNDVVVGDVDTGPEMHFSFADLVEHVAKTRAFAAGTILGSGTVSNAAPERGVSCLVERRAQETIDHGAPTTAYLKKNDRIRIELFDEHGRSPCGAIDQVVI